ncbi:minor capsid protein [Paenibacillus naphthalenovorans]|uniref:minor capsid protein n=1 Tax=Paenibacillus naphthalenovorans TaxID=162209 RepID=UPI00088411CB|nr:minor capsid protein [Paenibacillus naphthalenovorans]SDI49392.1 phage putative head morphogenesis protein, SPP1 gp7 family [Paenibacillus naphthalenovorans]
MSAARQFQPVGKRSLNEIDRIEAKGLRGFKEWLDNVRSVTLKHIRWSLPVETLQLPGGLDKVLQEAGRTALQSGKRQAKRETNALKRHYRKKRKKLAMAPPTFSSFKVTPVEAIRAMDERENYIAGRVTDDLFAELKGVVKGNLDDQYSRPEAESKLQDILGAALDRASLIITTETTYGVNRGRLLSFAEDGVDYVEFIAIRDQRTSVQCNSRHGKVMRLNDPQLADNTPPLHGRCRSLLSPIYSAFEPDVVSDPKRIDWSNAQPLPSGWRR